MIADTIELTFEILSGHSFKKIDGIMMGNCLLVEAKINGLKILGETFYEDGLIVFDELENSIEGGGDFLVFTCACGVADDGGWGMTSVQHKEDRVEWIVRRGVDEKKYSFEKQRYQNSIEQLKREAEHHQKKGLKLEPVNPIPPE